MRITLLEQEKKSWFENKLPVIVGTLAAVLLTAIVLGTIGFVSTDGTQQQSKRGQFFDVLAQFENGRAAYTISAEEKFKLLKDESVLAGFVNAHNNSVMAGDIFLLSINSIRKCRDNGGDIGAILKSAETNEIPASAIQSCNLNAKELANFKYMLSESKNFLTKVQPLWFHCVECGQSGLFSSCTQCGSGTSAVFQARMKQQRKLVQAK